MTNKKESIDNPCRLLYAIYKSDLEILNENYLKSDTMDERKKKDPFMLRYNIPEKDIENLDSLIRQYNELWEPPMLFSGEIMEKFFNEAKKLAESVIEEFPNFPEGYQCKYNRPFIDDANSFCCYCQDKKKDLPLYPYLMGQEYYYLCQSFIEECKERGLASHMIHEIEVLGETLAWKNVWDEYSNKLPEIKNKL